MDLPSSSQISVRAYGDICKKNKKHVLLDVRSDVQFNLVSFLLYKDESVNENNDTAEIEGSSSNINNSDDKLDNNTDNKRDIENDTEYGKKNKINSVGFQSNTDLREHINENVSIVHCPLSQLKTIFSDKNKIEAFRSNLSFRKDEIDPNNGSSSSNSIGSSASSSSSGSSSSSSGINFDNTETKDNNENNNKNDNKQSSSNDNDDKNNDDFDIYCICRRGNDSILATQILLKNGFCNVRNITGGLTAWNEQVDTSFPMY